MCLPELYGLNEDECKNKLKYQVEKVEGRIPCMEEIL